jgi:hypothetical protein
VSLLQAPLAARTPEQNQLLKVRGRHQVINEIQTGSIAHDVLGDTHQVQPTSVEDDGRLEAASTYKGACKAAPFPDSRSGVPPRGVTVEPWGEQ